jgi:hypothetical protein
VILLHLKTTNMPRLRRFITSAATSDSPKTIKNKAFCPQMAARIGKRPREAIFPAHGPIEHSHGTVARPHGPADGVPESSERLREPIFGAHELISRPHGPFDAAHGTSFCPHEASDAPHGPVEAAHGWFECPHGQSARVQGSSERLRG